MYRRVNSGKFIVITTAGIGLIMAIFTWVMYGMAQQVFTMTDVMLELNQSIKSMVVTQTSMTADMHTMSQTIVAMNDNIDQMNTSIAQMNGNVGAMTGSVVNMSESMNVMAYNVNRMTYDIGNASQAFSQPLSYMFGNPFGF